MKIEIFLTHENLPKHDYQSAVAVIIDVLRATTSITAALMNGAVSVIPVNEPAEAFSLRKDYNYLLAGERNGLIIDGFDFGNSPLEFTSEKVRGKTIVFCTSNGTQAMRKTCGFEHALLASFINIKSLVDYTKTLEKDTFIVCAGTLGNSSLEDTVCGGMIAYMLGGNPTVNALKAISIYHRYKDNVRACMDDSHHGRYLAKLGFHRDLDFASRISITDAVPVLNTENNFTRVSLLRKNKI